MCMGCAAAALHDNHPSYNSHHSISDTTLSGCKYGEAYCECARAHALAGVFVAMRYGAPSLQPPGGSGSDRRRKAAAKRQQDLALPWTPLQLTAAVVDISKAPALLGASSGAADVVGPQSRYPDQSAGTTVRLGGA